MLTEFDIIEQITKTKQRPDDEELRALPYRKAFIYGRVSSPSQMKDSHESIRELAKLVQLAINDGYQTDLNPIEVEQWLIDIQKGEAAKGVMENGEVTVDVRDLGISGRLSADSKEGLSNLQRQVGDDVTGSIYLTEGVSRLSRDQDKILPFQLLKLLKDHLCRIRTPDGIWNPAIERDWGYLADEFDYAVDEGKINIRRLYRRRKQKAARGEYVGGPVPPGFIVEIKEIEASGRYIYGKYLRYPPHADIAEQVLREYLKNGFSGMKAHHALGGLSYPLFPPELQYMERLSSLRKATKIEGVGYRISPSMIPSLAMTPELIGIWTWGDIDPIPGNHEPAVSVELWLEAYQGVVNSVKPRGRGIRHEPLEWNGLLLCLNHELPLRVSGHASKGAYRCQLEYVQGIGPSCFDIAAHHLDKPLTEAVLQKLVFTSFAEEVLVQMETDAAHSNLEEDRQRKEIAQLECRIENLKELLGFQDKTHDQLLLEQIEKSQSKREELMSRPVPTQTLPVASYQAVKDFLTGLPSKWPTYPRALRNRLLKRLVDHVDICHHGQTIEATICWKTGQSQTINIHRARAKGNRESHWSVEELAVLKKLWSATSQDKIMVALPQRTWKAIAHQAYNLGLKRTYDSSKKTTRRRWEPDEESRARQLYEVATPVPGIASKLERTCSAVLQRAWEKGWRRSQSDQRMAVAEFSSTNQNPEVSKSICSGGG